MDDQTRAKIARLRERRRKQSMGHCGLLSVSGSGEKCLFTAPRRSALFGVHFMLEHPDWWADNPERHAEYLEQM